MAANVKAIPDGYHSIQPYLYFQNSSDAITFYGKAFGATERMRMLNKDGRVGHAEIQIGDSCIMMADENPQIGALSPTHYKGSPVSFMVYVEDCDDVYNQALAAGATSLRPPTNQFYGDRMAGVADPFGFHWWIGTHIKDVSKEELEQVHP